MYLDDGLGEVHLLKDDGIVGVAKRLAGRRVLAADQGDDVARARHLDVGAVVGVHLEHAADALALVLDRVEHRRALLEHARVHARERERADEGVGHDLEGERRKRLVVRRRARRGGLAVDERAGDVVDVGRRGHVVNDRVEQRLHALVLEGGARDHGDKVAGEGALADALLQLRLGRLLALKVGHHEVVVLLDDELDELVAPLVRLLLQVVGDLAHLELGAERLVVPDDRLHLDEVDHANEVGLRADGQLQHGGGRAEQLDDRVDAEVEVGAGAVHLVQEAHARHVVLVSLAPHSLRLRLDTSDTVEDGDGAVEHTERALDLEGEVDVAGRVDDVDAVLARADHGAAARLSRVPVARRRSRGDGDAALLLLLHPVHGGATLVHLTDLVRLAGVEEDALGRRRLASVNVGHDTDVAVHAEVHRALCDRSGVRGM